MKARMTTLVTLVAGTFLGVIAARLLTSRQTGRDQ
jgi:uncharacterized membrane-anchored protein YhcB (DUF1043 family)